MSLSETIYDDFILNLSRPVYSDSDLWLLSDVIYYGLVEYVVPSEEVIVISSLASNSGLNKWKKNEKHMRFFGVKPEHVSKAQVILVILYEHSHYSLLVYQKRDGLFYFYNTLWDLHRELPIRMAQALKDVGICLNVKEGEEIRAPDFIPDQEGSWQCGYITFELARIIIERVKRGAKLWLVTKKDISECYPDIGKNKACYALRERLLQFFVRQRELYLEKRTLST